VRCWLVSNRRKGRPRRRNDAASNAYNPGATIFMNTSTKSAIAAMEGNGFYNRHSSLQAAGIAAVLPLWERVASAVEIVDETLVIADYGSSQGRNSMAPIRIGIEALRAKAGSNRPVEVIHTDLPSNDFASNHFVHISVPHFAFR
jgi:hypothetical protein